MQTAFPSPSGIATLSDLRAGATAATVMDTLFPVDQPSAKPQLIESDCCSSNNYEDR